MKGIRKPQDLWNIALFILSGEESVFSCVMREPDKRFTPQNIIRTEFHQITGYADPFLFVNQKDGYLYLFHEEERLKAKAPIRARRTKDLKHWEDLGVVLREKHHLSYPNVFNFGDDIYMLPETRECDAIILYRAIEFPYRWEKYRVLVEGDKYADSCIFFHNGLWYLFTTAWYGKKNGLRLFYSESIDGEYTEHPQSPVTDDVGLSRCGGAVFQYGGKMYRPAQFCTNYYGESLNVYEITELSTTIYKERFVTKMIDKGSDWNVRGGHHLNTTVYKGKRLVVMDGIVNDNWLNNRTRKFFNYFHRLGK